MEIAHPYDFVANDDWTHRPESLCLAVEVATAGFSWSGIGTLGTCGSLGTATGTFGSFGTVGTYNPWHSSPSDGDDWSNIDD